MPDAFLRSCLVRSIDNGCGLSCDAAVLGLQRGYFPATIETDVGRGDPLRVDHPVFDEDGNFVGVAYRQSSGCEVLVFLD